MTKKTDNSGENLNPKERILLKAMELFYRQGFANTGINQIIDESSSFKKSFYTYFEDKNSLGLNYLEIQEKDMLSFMRRMTTKYPTYESFAKSWVSVMKKSMRSKEYRGCPFANFRNQTVGDKTFEKKIQSILKNWKASLVDFINRLKLENKFPSDLDSEKVAKKMILLYEGTIQSFIMTYDPIYLEILEEELLAIKFKKS